MATRSLDELKVEVKQMIVQVSGLGPEVLGEIGDQSPLFQGGLGLDSVDVLELVVALDKKYGIKIRNDDAGKQVLTNVESIAQAVHSHCAAN
ncbi:MAG: phosphopantetheine-binding protein [Oligoflexales bacterium]